MRFQTRRDTTITILYAIVSLGSIAALYFLIAGIIRNFGIRDIFLDVIGAILVLFLLFMAVTIYLINYFEFDLENNEIGSKAGLGFMERYKFKTVQSCERKRKYFVTSALSVDVFQLILERDKKEGKIVLFASPKDEEGFIAALKQNCRNIKFIDHNK